MIVTKVIDGRVLSVSERYVLLYKRGSLVLYSNDQKNKFINKITLGNWTRNFTFLNRLFRKEPRCAVEISNFEFLISYDGKILRYDIKANKLFEEHRYGKGMKNPLCFCVEKKTDGTNNIYYGEYIWNEKKEPVAIYKRCKKGWHKVFEFSAGMITHIHNIVFDENKKCFYILTGDMDKESGIWIANYDFSLVRPLVIGKQAYRACVLFPVDDGVVFATDTPLEKNSISKMIVKDNTAVSIQKITALPGSCIYGGLIDGNYYFATTVEPDSSLSNIRYRCTYKLGKGIRDRYSYIICITKDGIVKEIYKSRKDIFPMWLFQFGNFIFPYNETNNVIVVAQALKCGHGKSLLLGDGK